MPESKEHFHDAIHIKMPKIDEEMMNTIVEKITKFVVEKIQQGSIEFTDTAQPEEDKVEELVAQCAEEAAKTYNQK